MNECRNCGDVGWTIEYNDEGVEYIDPCFDCFVAAHEADLAPGDDVITSGYEGVIVSVYEAPTEDTSGMYVVGLARGEVCVSGKDIRRAA